MMIEELAKVVKKFEGQLGTVKTQNELYAVSKVDIAKVNEIERALKS